LDSKLSAILAGLDSRDYFHKSLRALVRLWPTFESELIAALQSSDYDRRPRYYGLHTSLKELIWQARLEAPTSAKLKSIAFLLDDPETNIRAFFAGDVAGIGKPYVVPLVEMALKHPDSHVAEMTLCGIRDALDDGASATYRRRVKKLILETMGQFGADPYGPLFEVMETLSPKTHAEMIAELDRRDSLRKYFNVIDKAERGSFQKTLAALEKKPAGYKYLFALQMADAEIRNGGVDQYHRNSCWSGVLTAIEGARAFGADALAKLFIEMLSYYCRQDRSRLKKRIPEALLPDLESARMRRPENIDSAYDRLIDGFEGGIDGLFRTAVDRCPHLFRE
jgi:hypothetical protein